MAWKDPRAWVVIADGSVAGIFDKRRDALAEVRWYKDHHSGAYVTNAFPNREAAEAYSWHVSRRQHDYLNAEYRARMARTIARAKLKANTKARSV